MKKGVKILLSLLSIAPLITGCNSSNEDKKQDCDPDFEDCDKKDDEEKKEVKLESYKESNYVYDESVSNKDGSVSYEIFVRSFYDSNNDGIGDFKGIEYKLDYLEELGVKTLWLMPIHPSHSYHGYDVDDYYDVNSDYGTLDDFKELCKAAKDRNIDIMIDMVLNHSSKYNQWFIESKNDYLSKNTSETSKASWYSWSDTRKDGYSEYQDDKGNKAYCEARFSESMPEFNFNNQDVLNEMIKIMDYWIDLGVKGFRLDAAKYYDYNNTINNCKYLTYFKEHVKDPNCYFVSEVWEGINIVNDYYKSKCDSFFKFNNSLNGSGSDAILGQVKGLRKANDFSSSIESQEATLKENNPNGYSSYFLANHDMDRAAHSLSGTYAKDAASLLLMLPGTPFIYYGEEIGLKGKRGSESTDCMRRLPMIWNKNSSEGKCLFPEQGYEYLMNSFNQVSEGADDLLNSGYSLTNHYKKVINVRNKYSFIKNSIYINKTKELNNLDKHYLAYSLKGNNDEITVIFNFENENAEIDVSKLGTKIVDEVSSNKLIPELNNGKLKIGAHSFVIIK